MLFSVPIFVIHVRGNKEREQHITKELNKNRITFSFILDGNKEDITKNVLEFYFDSYMKAATAATSCSLKHLLCYEKVLANQYPYALILEDDITLTDDFKSVFPKSMSEIQERGLKNILVSYENSSQKYVKSSEIKKGQLLYKQQHGRCTGAYLVDLNAAKTIMNYVYSHKCTSSIDWLHNDLIKKELINIYWSHPHIAEQKSHNGTMRSLIDINKHSLIKRLTFQINKFYKQRILYKLK